MAGSVLFLTDSETDVDRFIREYVLDAIDRTRAIDGCEGISFDRDEQLNPDGDSVVLVVIGDFEAFVDRERERWEQYQESGLIEDWEAISLDDDQLAWKFGEPGTDLATRLLPLGGEMAKVVYEGFEGEPFPDPVDAYPEEDGWFPVGWWSVLHHVTVGNLGYAPSEEIEMCLAAIEADLQIIAERKDPETVDTKIDELLDALEGMREEVKNGRPRPEASQTR